MKAVPVGGERPVWLKGKVVEWNDDRGFGWVESEPGASELAGGKERDRIFAHIKDFGRGPRPRVGDEVTFSMGEDHQGRACAKGLRSLRKVLALQAVGRGAFAWLLLLLVLPVLASFKLPLHSGAIPAWMLVMSVVTWFQYRSDKNAAAVGAWRISEATLHFTEILGGWPGAYLAQRAFRHKTAKLSYRVVFLGIVFLYQVVALDVLLDHWLSAQVLEYFREPVAQ